MASDPIVRSLLYAFRYCIFGRLVSFNGDTSGEYHSLTALSMENEAYAVQLRRNESLCRLPSSLNSTITIIDSLPAKFHHYIGVVGERKRLALLHRGTRRTDHALQDLIGSFASAYLNL